jgi:hypothetical protein
VQARATPAYDGSGVAAWVRACVVAPDDPEASMGSRAGGRVVVSGREGGRRVAPRAKSRKGVVPMPSPNAVRLRKPPRPYRIIPVRRARTG